MRRTQFVNGEFYHVYNRGVEKRDIFIDEQDYFRAIHALYVFNDTNSHLHLAREIVRGPTSTISRETKPPQRDLLVDIIAYCLMPNHYHLFLQQRQKDGIAKFMQKLGTGYTMYFNKRYERSGVLFQGKFKSILVNKEKYFLTLLNYMHLNPVDLIQSDWKEEGIKNWQKVHKFLEEYRWSSYRDYIGIKNFPSVINNKPSIGYFPKSGEYKNYVIEWLRRDIQPIENLTLE